MTTIGTPLSPSATRVMLLGSGELGKEVLIALQRLGVETIAVDRYENAPGHQVAHRAHTIAMSDPAQLKALVEAVNELRGQGRLLAYHDRSDGGETRQVTAPVSLIVSAFATLSDVRGTLTPQLQPRGGQADR